MAKVSRGRTPRALSPGSQRSSRKWDECSERPGASELQSEHAMRVTESLFPKVSTDWE